MSIPTVELHGPFARDGETLAAGYGFVDGEGYADAALASCLPDDGGELSETLADVGGFWAVIHEGEPTVVTVDRLRSHPLYYVANPTSAEGPLVTDDVDTACHSVAGDPGDDPLAAGEYLLTGRVSRDETLVPDIVAIPPGTQLVIEGDDTRYVEHVKYTHENTSSDNLTARYEQAIETAFNRLIEYADGRPIAVSLSGGHDSRLVATELARREYDPVVAFTYGGAHTEREVAERVAADLELPWSFVDFDHETFRAWYRSLARPAFDCASGWIASVPNPSLAFAMELLRRRGDIPRETVVVTGDGPQTTGEHLPTSFRGSVSRSQFVDELLAHNYGTWVWNRDRYQASLGERVLATVPDAPFEDGTERVPVEVAASAYERWDWRERQAKRIRSTPAYEHAGFDWWFPLWDTSIMEFWQSVPLEHRRNKRFHDRYTERYYTRTSSLSAPEETFSSGKSRMRTHLEQVIGTTPVVGQLARAIRDRLASPGRSYYSDPTLGMVDSKTFDDVVDRLSDRSVPPSVYFHALLLLDRIEADRVPPSLSIFPE
ncbi:asparagine synthase C-terminal domain-containing protein [Halosegnis rubeus]|nr:asparagine synthase C-terminal domain-containing protein [Halosegnis rubeus]